MLIYPFSKIEKQCEEINEAVYFEEVGINYDNCVKYFSIYGIEAVLVACVLNKNLDDKSLQIGWKFMNKLYDLLSKNYAVQTVDDKILLYLNRAENYFKKKKFHLYIGQIFHIIKRLKFLKRKISLKEKEILLKLLSSFFPYLNFVFD